MITIPLYFTLVFYFLFLVVFSFFFVTNILHLVLTGATTFTSFLITIAMIAAAAMVIWSAWYFTAGTDWLQPVTIWNSGWFNYSPSTI